MRFSETNEGSWGYEHHTVELLFTIRVAEHKTSQTFGPANITMDKNDHQGFAKYMKNIRPHIIQQATQYIKKGLVIGNPKRPMSPLEKDEKKANLKEFVFITLAAEKIRHFSSKSYLYKIQEECGMAKMNLTTARKATATKGHDVLPERLMGILCDGQAHSRRTTEKYYVAQASGARMRTAYAINKQLRVSLSICFHLSPRQH
jgi:hypothetical protein